MIQGEINKDHVCVCVYARKHAFACLLAVWILLWRQMFIGRRGDAVSKLIHLCVSMCEEENSFTLKHCPSSICCVCVHVYVCGCSVKMLA